MTTGEKGGPIGLYARLEEEVKDIELNRDPFFRQTGSTFSGPSLEGIIWDFKNPTAVINDRIVVIGNKVDGYTVIDIQENQVILSDDKLNKEFTLKLFE